MMENLERDHQQEMAQLHSQVLLCIQLKYCLFTTTCAEPIFIHSIYPLILKMASAQVVETSIANDSPSQDSCRPDVHFQGTIPICD